MSVIALVALLAVPILYGGLYLWANQDPYGSLSRVPVALVVQDEGATIDGTQRDFGDEVAKELLGGDTFDWHRVSASTAERGLADGTYDFTVEIPADLSAAIASASSGSPRQAGILLHTTDANNYLASTIGPPGVARLQETIATQAVDQAA